MELANPTVQIADSGHKKAESKDWAKLTDQAETVQNPKGQKISETQTPRAAGVSRIVSRENTRTRFLEQKF